MTSIKAVAKLAQVSPSTVSYVLSGSRPISAETQARVREAIDRLGYEPNASARALRTTQTKVLALQGFVTAGHTEAAVTGVFILAVAEAVRERGYDILLIPSQEGPAGIERLSRTSRVDAIVVMGILLRDPRVEALRGLRLPAALMGHPEFDPGVSWVDLDFNRAGRVAVSLLADQGHRKVLFVGPPAHIYKQGAGYAVRGLQGAKDGAKECGVKLLGPIRVDKVPDLGRQLEAAFAKTPDLTAVVLQYESALPELLRWLRSTNRRVPEDIRVVLVGAWSRDNTESQVTYVSSTVGRLASAVVNLAIGAAEEGVIRSELLPPEVWVSRH
jgi:DNA-binding LacI/PurR family transcriptional regulator